jgi:3-deoxy-D-manno-octulosonate 8-phosphate phosphatase (KDO 8-P phosphatase)
MSVSAELLRQRCAPIEMLVLDVDGVLTDGSIIYGEGGLEIKAFHVRDGAGVKIWHSLGKRSAIITGRTSRAVARRAAELGISPVFQGAADKGAAFEQVLGAVRLQPVQICCLGDDLPDCPLFATCGLAVAVSDASLEVKNAAHYVTTSSGGRGAVRETIELILRSQGRWQQVLERFACPLLPGVV